MLHTPSTVSVVMMEDPWLLILSLSFEASLLLPAEGITVEYFYPSPGAMSHHSMVSVGDKWGAVKKEFLPLSFGVLSEENNKEPLAPTIPITGPVVKRSQGENLDFYPYLAVTSNK